MLIIILTINTTQIKENPDQNNIHLANQLEQDGENQFIHQVTKPSFTPKKDPSLLVLSSMNGEKPCAKKELLIATDLHLHHTIGCGMTMLNMHLLHGVVSENIISGKNTPCDFRC